MSGVSAALVPQFVCFSCLVFGVFFVSQVKSTGQTLFDTVVAKLRLVETDYFDLEYVNSESIPVSTLYSLLIETSTNCRFCCSTKG